MLKSVSKPNFLLQQGGDILINHLQLNSTEEKMNLSNFLMYGNN